MDYGLGNPIVADASDTYDLGDASRSIIGTFVLQIIGTGFTGSVEIQGKAIGAPTSAFSPIAYKDRADDTTGTTALTTDSIVEVNVSGLEVRLDVTVTLGSVTIYIVPLLG